MPLRTAWHSHRSNYSTKLGRLTEIEARKYMSQLIDGLTYCHGLNVVHRNLKVNYHKQRWHRCILLPRFFASPRTSTNATFAILYGWNLPEIQQPENLLLDKDKNLKISDFGKGFMQHSFRFLSLP